VVIWSFVYWRNLAALTRLKEVAATPVAAFLEEAKNMARTLSNRGDRFGLVVASAAVAGVVIMGVLYTLTSERLRPAPKPSAETSPSSQSPGAGGG
jgi:hypothetical protein